MKTELEFFDCNTYIGMPMNKPSGQFGSPPATPEALLAAMDRAGIARALVWDVSQHDTSAVVGNELLTHAIAGRDRLVGTWTILPPQTREVGEAEGFFARARECGIRAFRAFPGLHRYLLRREVIGELVDRMIAARAPLILSLTHVAWEAVYDLLAEAPELTVILANTGSWNADRYFRPLLDRYPRAYVETSGYITDGAIETFVERSGGGRLLFGSAFPESYHGAAMLGLAHAEISRAEKRAIAGGTLSRLLSEVAL